MDDKNAFFEALHEGMKQQKKAQRSDDIITFITDNWKIFSPNNRGAMIEAYRSLGRDVTYSVDSLCDALGIPSNVYFKRSPVADIGGAILNFENSSLLKLFDTCVEKSERGEVCLFIVAGTKSICITNMQTHFEEAVLDIKFKRPESEIHIFKAKDASHRLRNLFNHK